ncbi:nucleotidyl transferase AbiEii/AbiGii toxin family protein [Maribellus sediminis]|uniref:nucleotidyl transferase AbiEii/AbiGii toxin family protein n=1 Tax=Maribellus sediminis TaxID=2696285 RepID=UPI00197EC316|nr:nucleotidyl transferase AbiEii/AbiGii toxin family protein [Maribellus sediminis]
MLSHYDIKTKEDRLNAMHEVMQQVCLAGLNRAGFFESAAFYGGTCLRIFHKLPRFSEDMDFSLMETSPDFKLENYFDAIQSEFVAVGRNISIEKKEKKLDTHIESAFLKDTTDIVNIRFNTEPGVKIKIEVDKNPPLNFKTEYKLLLLPFSFMTRCFTLPGLFAGKMHALLFRNWRNRVKGRDWYDFEWYIRNNIPLDFNHFKERAVQSEGPDFRDLSHEQFVEMLKNKLNTTKIEQVIEDVRRFVVHPRELEIWSTEYFLQLLDLLRFEEK